MNPIAIGRELANNVLDMPPETYLHTARDGASIHCFCWKAENPRATVYIAHGMGEHALRYERLASALNDASFQVVSNDHRGHGHTANTLGDFGPDGWNRILEDMQAIISNYSNPGPTILLGHSMGALLAQQYVTRYNDLDALVLSGSPGFTPPALLRMGLLVAWWEAIRLGPLKESAFMTRQLFGAPNGAFASNGESTGFEWLTTDKDAMHRYMKDPWCGFVPFPESLKGMYRGMLSAQSQQAYMNNPSTLPVYLFSGSDDPLHRRQTGIRRLIDCWSSTGIKVDQHIYEGGRHELLNDVFFDEVSTDLIDWLNKAVFGSE